MKLSVATAHALQPGETLKDHVVRGLELRAKGTVKSWQLYYRIGGVQRRPKIGEFPTIGIEDARDIAKEWLQRIARGEDPSAEKVAYRRAPTVADLWTKHREMFVDGKLEPETVSAYERGFRLHIGPALGALKACDVTLADISKFLDRYNDRIPSRNKLRAQLSVMFNTAERQDVAMRPRGSNPVTDTQVIPEGERERHLTGAEFVAINTQLAALRPLYPARVAALYVLLMTGSRVTELVKTRRDEIIDRAIVRKGHKAWRRTGKTRRIYLCRQALEEIATIPDDGSGLLFGAGLTRHNIFDVWEIAREKAGCPDATVHDLRRTFASAAKSGRVSLDQIGELLGHAKGSTVTGKRYAFLFDDAVREAVQSTGDVVAQRLIGAG